MCLHIFIYMVERVTVKSLLKWNWNAENISGSPALSEYRMRWKKNHLLVLCIAEHSISCLIITRHWQNQEFTAQDCYVTWAQLHKNGIRKYPGKTLTFILTSRLYNVHHSDVCTSKKESSGNKINLSLAAMILIQNNLEIIGQQWTDHLVISVCMIKAEFLKKLLLFILFYS